MKKKINKFDVGNKVTSTIDKKLKGTIIFIFKKNNDYLIQKEPKGKINITWLATEDELLLIHK